MAVIIATRTEAQLDEVERMGENSYETVQMRWTVELCRAVNNGWGVVLLLAAPGVGEGEPDYLTGVFMIDVARVQVYLAGAAPRVTLSPQAATPAQDGPVVRMDFRRHVLVDEASGVLPSEFFRLPQADHWDEAILSDPPRSRWVTRLVTGVRALGAVVEEPRDDDSVSSEDDDISHDYGEHDVLCG